MNRSSQPSRTHLPRGLFEAAPDHSAVTRLGCGFRSNGTSEPIPVRWLTVDQSRLRMLCVHVCVSQTHYCMLCEVIHSMYTPKPHSRSHRECMYFICCTHLEVSSCYNIMNSLVIVVHRYVFTQLTSGVSAASADADTIIKVHFHESPPELIPSTNQNI